MIPHKLGENMKAISLAIGTLVFAIGVLWLKVWIVGSLITSGVKAVSDKCGTTYSVEGVVGITGNWFCPTEGE